MMPPAESRMSMMSMMTRTRIGAALVLLVATAVPAAAELRYTMTIATRPVSGAATPADPVAGRAGEAVLGMLAQADGLELTVTVGEPGTRVDYSRAYLIVPAGGSTIVRPDGSMVVIDPAARTYWRMARPEMAPARAQAPEVSLVRTGEAATVAGTRAERATMRIRVPLPASGGDGPAGAPTEFILSGEVWLADGYRAYARMGNGPMAASVPGLDALASDGLVVRSILRGALLGAREIESVVTSLAEVDVAPALFEVPSGFTEVPPPATR